MGRKQQCPKPRSGLDKKNKHCPKVREEKGDDKAALSSEIVTPGDSVESFGSKMPKSGLQADKYGKTEAAAATMPYWKIKAAAAPMPADNFWEFKAAASDRAVTIGTMGSVHTDGEISSISRISYSVRAASDRAVGGIIEARITSHKTFAGKNPQKSRNLRRYPMYPREESEEFKLRYSVMLEEGQRHIVKVMGDVLKQRQYVVPVTADGTNDAPALHEEIAVSPSDGSYFRDILFCDESGDVFVCEYGITIHKVWSAVPRHMRREGKKKTNTVCLKFGTRCRLELYARMHDSEELMKLSEDSDFVKKYLDLRRSRRDAVEVMGDVLKQRQYVVPVTADGTNDAPALHEMRSLWIDVKFSESVLPIRTPKVLLSSVEINLGRITIPGEESSEDLTLTMPGEFLRNSVHPERWSSAEGTDREYRPESTSVERILENDDIGRKVTDEDPMFASVSGSNRYQAAGLAGHERTCIVPGRPGALNNMHGTCILEDWTPRIGFLENDISGKVTDEDPMFESVSGSNRYQAAGLAGHERGPGALSSMHGTLMRGILSTVAPLCFATTSLVQGVGAISPETAPDGPLQSGSSPGTPWYDGPVPVIIAIIGLFLSIFVPLLVWKLSVQGQERDRNLNSSLRSFVSAIIRLPNSSQDNTVRDDVELGRASGTSASSLLP